MNRRTGRTRFPLPEQRQFQRHSTLFDRINHMVKISICPVRDTLDVPLIISIPIALSEYVC